jgi:asparagine synthase (glutamine-hydrolysing)
MCGICGKVYHDPQRLVERETVAAMCGTLLHRGPDDQGTYVKGQVGLGAARLSIIDVAGGRQPLSNEDGTVWIAYNGEVYNFPQLRERLERAGHSFATCSDTEAIVHLYEEEGDRFVRSLNGMFALAIWDERKRRLILARDHLGIKPLFYAQQDDRLLFGSEIKALLPDGLDRRIDPLALHDYLSLNYVPGPRTMFAGVRKLPPGHILTFEAATRQVTIERFWDLPRSGGARTTRARPLGELEDSLLGLLREAVSDQMVSDVPIGAFLSGGIDSSVVVALMSEVSHRPVKTFSVGFKERSYDELPYARIVADRFKTDHHELVLEPRAHEIVAELVDWFDEPFADSSAVAVYAVSQLAAGQIKVALSGDGGDELFGGYYTYQADKLAAFYRRLPKAVGARLLPRLADMVPASDRKVSLDFKLKRFVGGASLPPLPAHVAWKTFLSEEMKSRLYGPAYANGHGETLRPTVDLMQEYFDGYPGDDLMNRLLYVDTKVQLVDDMLTKVDRMSMAHSLEVRVPLLDLRLVEFVAKLPSDLKVRRLELKYLLKRAAARLLPDEILRRPKAGFHVPIPLWIKTDLRDMIEEHLSPRAIAEQGIFDPRVVSDMLEAHWRGRRDHSRNIWSLLIFSSWYERYFRGVPGGRPEGQTPVPSRVALPPADR